MAALYFIMFAFRLVAGMDTQYGGKGMKTTLIPSITGQPDNILWKYMGNKVVEFDGSEQKEYGSYNNRIVLDWVTTELTILDLRHEDSGTYELEAANYGSLQTSKHQLLVIDEVAQPAISCVINDTSEFETEATLLCSTEPKGPPSLMKLEWRGLRGDTVGPKLSIIVRGSDDETVYTCGVGNPVSDKQTMFVAKNCYPDESSSTALIASMVVLLIILICLLLAALWLYRKYKIDTRKSKRHDEENNPLRDKTNNSRPGNQEREPLCSNAATLPSKQPLAFLVPSGHFESDNLKTIKKHGTSMRNAENGTNDDGFDLDKDTAPQSIKEWPPAVQSSSCQEQIQSPRSLEPEPRQAHLHQNLPEPPDASVQLDPQPLQFQLEADIPDHVGKEIDICTEENNEEEETVERRCSPSQPTQETNQSQLHTPELNVPQLSPKAKGSTQKPASIPGPEPDEHSEDEGSQSTTTSKQLCILEPSKDLSSQSERLDNERGAHTVNSKQNLKPDEIFDKVKEGNQTHQEIKSDLPIEELPSPSETGEPLQEEHGRPGQSSQCCNTAPCEDGAEKEDCEAKDWIPLHGKPETKTGNCNK
ncbi:uncharacterized protein FYW47_001403 [Aplochiton taeniatus]